MANVVHFPNAKNFQVGSQVFNTYVSGTDAIQFLEEHAATGAMHDSEERYPPPMCHAGTRDVVIVRIKDWYGFVTRPDKPIMWIHAPAGYGKTAIAGTISKMLEEVEGLDFNPLGATFYFWRTALERNSPARFIITIAYQLAMSIPELAPHVENAVKQNRLILRKSLEVQLVKLIVEPFKALGDLENMPNRLIIIDGLDECIYSTERACGDQEKQQTDGHEKAQIRIHELIRDLQSYQLPLSFLILSRPEEWIKQHMQSPSYESVVEKVDLYALGDHLNDAEKYIRDELARIELSVRNERHILYASIVIRHIDDPYHDPRDALRNLFNNYKNCPNPDLAHSSPLSSIYELYKQILRSCPAGNWKRMIEVLEELEAANWLLLSRLTFQRAVAVLDRLAGRVPGQGFRALRPLHSVLHLSDAGTPGSQTYTRLSPYIHSTFSSFLQDPCPALGLPIDKEEGCQRLLHGSLDFISKITPQTEITEDSLLYALQEWPSYFRSGWCSKPPDAQYFEALKKLLAIDISTCMIQAFATSRLWSFTRLYVGISKTDSRSCIVPLPAQSAFEREPLVQQAVAHVASSHEVALLNFLDQPPDVWPHRLGVRVAYFMRNLKKDSGTGRIVDEANRVVQALKRLQRERPKDARRLALHYEEAFSSFLPFDWIV